MLDLAWLNSCLYSFGIKIVNFCQQFLKPPGFYSFVYTVFLWSLIWAGVDGIIPVLCSVHPNVITSRGSNATLTCRGRKINGIDTMVSWKFNGKEVQENTNKIVTEEFLPRRRGTFSLHITNVSEKDVGKYTCIAYVANFGKPDVAEAIIDLKLYESGKETISAPSIMHESYSSGETNMLALTLRFSLFF